MNINDIVKAHIEKHKIYAGLISAGHSHKEAFIRAFGLNEWDQVQTILTQVKLENQIKYN